MCMDISRARDEVKIVSKDQSKVWRAKEMIGKLTAAASPPKEAAFRLHMVQCRLLKQLCSFSKETDYSKDLEISGHPSFSESQTVPQYLGTLCPLKWDRSAGTNPPGQVVERGCTVPLCNTKTAAASALTQHSWWGARWLRSISPSESKPVSPVHVTFLSWLSPAAAPHPSPGWPESPWHLPSASHISLACRIPSCTHTHVSFLHSSVSEISQL